MSIEAHTEVNQPEIENAVTEQVTEPTQEVEVAAPVNDDAAFEAGFNSAMGIETPEPAEAQAPAVEPEPEPEPEPQPVVAGYTQDQIKELLAKAAQVDKLQEQQDRIFGAIGNLKQSYEHLKNQPRPTAMQVSKLQKLGSMFPEMAELLEQDLSGVAVGGSSVDPDQVSQIVEQQVQSRLQKVQEQTEVKLLTIMHPDWKSVAPSDEFSKWKQAQPAEVQAQLDDSWDAEFLGSKLSEFKDWKKQTAASQQTKQRRLEAAITPKSVAAPVAPSEDDAFIAGFKSARGIK